jgi:hypothetical protein
VAAGGRVGVACARPRVFNLYVAALKKGWLHTIGGYTHIRREQRSRRVVVVVVVVVAVVVCKLVVLPDNFFFPKTRFNKKSCKKIGVAKT